MQMNFGNDDDKINWNNDDDDDAGQSSENTA